MKKRYYIMAFAAILLGIGAGIYYLTEIRPGNANIPDDIILETAFGNEYHMGEMNDTAKIVEFMYTQCPDVCPVTTLEMAKLKSQLEKEGVFGDEIEFITITIDPKRDDQEVIREYASRFEVESPDDGWIFLTGSEEDTQEIADALGFLYRDPGSGEIIHSTYTYFMDENDNLLEQFTMGEDFDRERAYNRIMRTIN